MSVRISHCSTSLDNYYICINERVSGFLNRGPQVGDLIYLVVKIGRKSVCGARFNLDEPTDYKPWPDSENYVNVLTTKNLEFCTPFDISIISQVGGKYWSMKYIQGAKPISDQPAIEMLDKEFSKYRIDSPYIFDIDPKYINTDDRIEDELTVEDVNVLKRIVKEIPDAKVSIMGTFQTVQFSNETDKIRGLESLVNDNFYSLFPQFPENNTLLIPENRLFKTKGIKKQGANVTGIRTIPDGILIEFNKKPKNPFRINLIEYECYGEGKTTGNSKSTYLNSVIIPQLMRFASSFSIITDENTRRTSVDQWVDKIIDYTNSDKKLKDKIIKWIKEIDNEIDDHAVDRKIEKLLKDSFNNNLRVILVIDELSLEQKQTIKNVVSSFKLANGDDNVQFEGYIVRLVQKINMINNEAEYALTIQ